MNPKLRTMAYVFGGAMALVAIRAVLHLTGVWNFEGF